MAAGIAQLLPLLESKKQSITARMPALMEMGFGAYDLIQAKKYGKKKDPGYTIPDEVYDALSVAENLAGNKTAISDLASPQIDRQVASNTSTAIDVAESGTDVLGSLSDIGVRAGEAISNLAIADYNNWANSLIGLRAELGNVAEWEDKKNAWEERQPYLAAMETARNFENSGRTEIMGGFSKFMGGKANERLYNEDLMKDVDWSQFQKPKGQTGTSGGFSSGMNEFVPNFRPSMDQYRLSKI